MKKLLGSLIVLGCLISLGSWTSLDNSTTEDVKKPCTLAPPSKFKCENNKTGMILGWSKVTGAYGYELELNFMASCCSEIGQPAIQTITVTTNYYVVPPTTNDCFTWRVRALCSPGNGGAWSGSQCSCGN